MTSSNLPLPRFAVCPSEDLIGMVLDNTLQLATNDPEGFEAVIRRLPEDIHTQEFSRFACLYLAVVLSGLAPRPTSKQLAMKAMDIETIRTARYLGKQMKAAQKAAIRNGTALLQTPLTRGLSKELTLCLLAAKG